MRNYSQLSITVPRKWDQFMRKAHKQILNDPLKQNLSYSSFVCSVLEIGIKKMFEVYDDAEIYNPKRTDEN